MGRYYAWSSCKPDVWNWERKVVLFAVTSNVYIFIDAWTNWFDNIGPISDLANWIDQDAAAALGLPRLEESEIPPCGIVVANGVECTPKREYQILISFQE